MSQLIECSLMDAVEAIVDNRGRSCPTVPNGIPLIATNCLKIGQREPVLENLRFVSQETYDSWFRAHPEPDDVLLVCKGNAGRVALVPDPVSFCIAQDMVALRANREMIIGRYLYYRLLCDDIQASIVNMHVGTMIPHFKKGDFARLRFSVHKSLDEQRAIADVLGAIDDKIAVNTKLAATADELVRSEYLALGASALESVTLGSIATNVRDLAEPDGSDSMYVGLEHVPRHLMWLTSSGSVAEVSSTKARFVGRDVLFGKLRPYFHKVVAAPSSGMCSTDILVLRAVDAELAGLVLAAAASDVVVSAVTASSEGTRMPRASWKDLAACDVPWPGDANARAFSIRVAELRDRVHARLRENESLAAIRDALLPALMSGRLTVRDAEAAVESAGDGGAIESAALASGTLW